eukprot:gene15199-23214_t
MGLAPHVLNDPAVLLAAQRAAAIAVRQAMRASGAATPSSASGYQHAHPYTKPKPAGADESGNAQYVGTQTGVVKSWSSANRYGFIKPDHGGADVHVILTSLTHGHRSLAPGDVVSFTYDVSELPRRRASTVWVTQAKLARAPPPPPVRGHAAVPMPAPYAAKRQLGGSRMRPPADVPVPPPPPPPAPAAAPISMQAETTGTGTVKTYNPAKGYGFILCDSTRKDIFVSAGIVIECGLMELQKGMASPLL